MPTFKPTFILQKWAELFPDPARFSVYQSDPTVNFKACDLANIKDRVQQFVKSVAFFLVFFADEACRSRV